MIAAATSEKISIVCVLLEKGWNLGMSERVFCMPRFLKNTLSKESNNKETKRSQVSGKRSLGSPERTRTSLELSPKKASKFETNTNIQESAAVKSLGKDLVVG